VAACSKKETPPPAAPEKSEKSAPAASGTPPAPATAAAMPVEGQEPPDFEAVATDGKTYKLSALKGKPAVVYFFPKADTPG
jgi:peroxiredoxin Q/BCP